MTFAFQPHSFFLFFFLFVFSVFPHSTAQANHSLGGIESLYSNEIAKRLSTKPTSQFDFSKIDKDSLNIQALASPGNEYYVGFELTMHVNTSIDRVSKVIEEFDDYVNYFPDYKEIRTIEKSDGRWVTYWEQVVPVFFIPNIKFQLIHERRMINPNYISYRYQLKEANLLSACDGIIFLEAASPNTKYTEYSFSETKTGIIRMAGVNAIWHDSFKGYYLSTMGVKLRSENPTWEFKKIIDESSLRFKKVNVDDILKEKRDFLIPKTANQEPMDSVNP